MKYSSRFFLYAPLGVFLVLFAAVGVQWWSKASALSGRLAAANGHEAMPGVTMRFAKSRISGFPFSLDTQLSNVSFAMASAHGPTRWTAEKFAMHALTYGRDETIFEAAGHQSLQWTREDGTVRTLPFAVGSLRASAIVQKGALVRFDFDLVGFGSKAFTAQRLQFHARQYATAIHLSVSADGLTNCQRSAIRHVAAVTIDEAFERLQLGEESWPDAVAAWRAAGGTTVPERKAATLSSLASDQILNPSAVGRAACGR
jgi:hypothetical protein